MYDHFGLVPFIEQTLGVFLVYSILQEMADCFLHRFASKPARILSFSRGASVINLHAPRLARACYF